ncbi:MAG: hypothetical protein L0219_00760 [Phycisphaerales bacterium]|nr:hypothetical protein [Phycisphaerales bacterium]MCI0674412.1 hypothetical protein [Phycisphaerales bacterium]
MTTRRIVTASSFTALVIACLAASILAQASPPSATQVVKLKLPLELPAIGNIEAAKNWRFGRIESVVQAGANQDVRINIRTEDNDVHEVIGPRVLGDLARASNWTSVEPNNPQVTRPDYVERMVAFDVDENNRIIAMISLEPMDRNRRRLERGLQ